MLRFRTDDVMEKYVIERKIGEGSMGAISKARIRGDKIGGSAYKSQGLRLCGCFGFFIKSREKMTSDPNSMREGRRDGEIYYALKTIVMSRISPEFVNELRNEIDILKGLDHPNIVKVRLIKKDAPFTHVRVLRACEREIANSSRDTGFRSL